MHQALNYVLGSVLCIGTRAGTKQSRTCPPTPHTIEGVCDNKHVTYGNRNSIGYGDGCNGEKEIKQADDWSGWGQSCSFQWGVKERRLTEQVAVA